jgi:hypothetical protein
MVRKRPPALSPVALVPDLDTPWYTRATAAAYARVHPRSVDEARRRGELVGARIAGRGRYRYHRVDLDRWLGGTRLRVVIGGAA